MKITGWKSLYKYFKTQFKDLEGAKKWVYIWHHDWDQKLPGEKECSYTMRSMAAHVSGYLEGIPPISHGWGTDYLMHKYGTDLYYAMCVKE